MSFKKNLNLILDLKLQFGIQKSAQKKEKLYGMDYQQEKLK